MIITKNTITIGNDQNGYHITNLGEVIRYVGGVERKEEDPGFRVDDYYSRDGYETAWENLTNAFPNLLGQVFIGCDRIVVFFEQTDKGGVSFVAGEYGKCYNYVAKMIAPKCDPANYGIEIIVKSSGFVYPIQDHRYDVLTYVSVNTSKICEGYSAHIDYNNQASYVVSITKDGEQMFEDEDLPSDVRISYANESLFYIVSYYEKLEKFVCVAINPQSEEGIKDFKVFNFFITGKLPRISMNDFIGLLENDGPMAVLGSFDNGDSIDQENDSIKAVIEKW